MAWHDISQSDIFVPITKYIVPTPSINLIAY